MKRSALFATLVLLGACAPPALSQPSATLHPRTADDVTERIAANDNRSAAGVPRDGVLELRLETRTGMWYPEAEDGPGIEVQAFAETGGPLLIPGPPVRVTEGTEIRLTLRNRLSETLVVYGLHARPGSPKDTLEVAAGASRELRFPAGAPGTYYYWASTTGETMEERGGVDSQLAGAFIVDPLGASPADRVFVMGVWVEWDEGRTFARRVMTINGKGWPYTERFDFTVGDQVHWRWLNPTRSSHPMHLHGFYFRVDSRGAWAADTVFADGDRRLAVTELMLPGGTTTFTGVPEREGNWLFHCHFPFHMGPEVSLGRTAPAHAHAAEEHGEHAMAGLVLGHPRAGAPRRRAGDPGCAGAAAAPAADTVGTQQVR
jgi:manganese oxidase